MRRWVAWAGLAGLVLWRHPDPAGAAVVREMVAEGRHAAGEAAHLLVSDLSLLEVDGLALVHAAQRWRPSLPAILLTGFATDAAEPAMQGAVSGSFSLLRKPVEAAALAERVAALPSGAAAAVEGDGRGPP